MYGVVFSLASEVHLLPVREIEGGLSSLIGGDVTKFGDQAEKPEQLSSENSDQTEKPEQSSSENAPADRWSRPKD
jgi:hypothetical protein